MAKCLNRDAIGAVFGTTNDQPTNLPTNRLNKADMRRGHRGVALPMIAELPKNN